MATDEPKTLTEARRLFKSPIGEITPKPAPGPKPVFVKARDGTPGWKPEWAEPWDLYSKSGEPSLAGLTLDVEVGLSVRLESVVRSATNYASLEAHEESILRHAMREAHDAIHEAWTLGRVAAGRGLIEAIMDVIERSHGTPKGGSLDAIRANLAKAVFNWKRYSESACR